MPFKEDETIRGWGVYREQPWHFAGIFISRVDAEEKAAELGDSYVVRLGDNQRGTDNFLWSQQDQPDA